MARHGCFCQPWWAAVFRANHRLSINTYGYQIIECVKGFPTFLALTLESVVGTQPLMPPNHH